MPWRLQHSGSDVQSLGSILQESVKLTTSPSTVVARQDAAIPFCSLMEPEGPYLELPGLTLYESTNLMIDSTNIHLLCTRGVRPTI